MARETSHVRNKPKFPTTPNDTNISGKTKKIVKVKSTLSPYVESQKFVKKTFGERKSVHGNMAPAGTLRKPDNADTKADIVSSSSKKSLKEKVSVLKRKKSPDEVDGFCSPSKLPKQDSSIKKNKCQKIKKIEGNLNVSNVSLAKTVNGSKTKDKLVISTKGSDEKKKGTKQSKSCVKEKDMAESKLNNESNKDQMMLKSNAKGIKHHKTSGQPSNAKKLSSGKKNIEKNSSKRSKKSDQKVNVIPSNSIKDVRPSTSKESDVSDPFAILMMMEGRSPSSPVLQSPVRSEASAEEDVSCSMDTSGDFMNDSDGSDEMSDWEDVQERPMPDAAPKSQIPDKPIEITMDLPDFLKKKKKKKEFDWKEYFEQRMRRFKKEVAASMHKTHLLCLIAHGLKQNSILNEPTISALILSFIPKDLARKQRGSLEEAQVEALMSWYKKKFPLQQVTHASQDRTVSARSMIKAVTKSSISDARIWVFVFISLLRTLGFKVRLILSFQLLPFKPNAKPIAKATSSKGKQSSKGTVKPKGKGKTVTATKQIKQDEVSSSSSSRPSSSSSSSKSKYFKASSKKDEPNTSSSSLPSLSLSSSRKQSSRRSKEQANEKNRQSLKTENDDEFSGGEEDSDAAMKKSARQKKPLKNVCKTKKSEHNYCDSDFEESPSYRLKKDLKVKSNRKVLSVSSEDDLNSGGEQFNAAKAHDFWMELYVTNKKKWICFDCVKSQFGKPYSLEQSATQPLSYVVGFRNDNSIRDVTARYAKQWTSQTRKIRVDADWIADTFSFFDFSTYKERIMEEDDVKSQLLVRPMPTSIGDFKNHPLYALTRHLLKFECIYPETAIPLGYVRNEPIYARECVRLLHSRQNWLKEGRMVRLKEESYKMVKSRPKWGKPKENPDELDLELFGEWQTEKYIPPPAVNGKVPRNDFGNVELFQPWMLPQGTVHLKVQGLQRVAKKLDIDVAAAMVGWDYHGGFSHPVMDGWVVCEEFADALLEAWDEDQENHRQREEEKKDKRVYGNWKRLIRGLLIKERLKNKFLKEKALVAVSEILKEKEDELNFSDAEPALPAEQFWPINRQEEERREDKKRAQEYKRQLEKEREMRKSGIIENLEDDEEAIVEVKPKKEELVFKMNSKAVSKSIANPEKRVNKRMSLSLKSKDKETNKMNKKDDKKKAVNKNKRKNEGKSEKRTQRKRAKNEQEEENDDDEEDDNDDEEDYDSDSDSDDDDEVYTPSAKRGYEEEEKAEVIIRRGTRTRSRNV